MDPHMTEEDRNIYELGPHRRLKQELAPPAIIKHVKKKKLVNFKVSLRRRSTKAEAQRRGSSGSLTIPQRPEGRKSSVTFVEEDGGPLHSLNDSLEDVRPSPQERMTPRSVPLERRDTKTLQERREAFRSTGEQRMAARRSLDRRSGTVAHNFSISRDQQAFRSIDLRDDHHVTLQRDDEVTRAMQHGLSIDSHRRTTPVDLGDSPTRTRAPSRTPPPPHRTSPLPPASSPPPPASPPNKPQLVKQVSISTPHQSIPPSPVKPHSRPPPPQRLDSQDMFLPVHRRKSDLSRSSSLSSSENWNKIKTVATPGNSRMNSLVEMLITRRKASLAPSIWTPSVPRTPPGPRPANFQDQVRDG